MTFVQWPQTQVGNCPKLKVLCEIFYKMSAYLLQKWFHYPDFVIQRFCKIRGHINWLSHKITDLMAEQIKVSYEREMLELGSWNFEIGSLLRTVGNTDNTWLNKNIKSKDCYWFRYKVSNLCVDWAVEW